MTGSAGLAALLAGAVVLTAAARPPSAHLASAHRLASLASAAHPIGATQQAHQPATTPDQIPAGLAAAGPVAPGLAAAGPVAPGLAAAGPVAPRLAVARLVAPRLAAAGLVAPGLAAAGLVAPGLVAAGTPSPHPVIVVGIAGLRWADVSPAATPAIWRLAGSGAIGTLVTTTINPLTCPADAWLTLNSGSRAAAPVAAAGTCSPPPAVRRLVLPGQGARPATVPWPAHIPAMRDLISYNRQFSYGPAWGVLGQAAGPGQCATAIGPGAALALANPAGDVSRYLPALPSASRSYSMPFVLRQCSLTVADLGALPGSAALARGPGASSARAPAARSAALRSDDQAVGLIAAAARPGTIVVLVSAGDAPGPHLGVIIVAGPGYRSGLVTSASTRQPGVVAITDLTPSVLAALARPVPPRAAPLTGAVVTVGPRGPLAAEIRVLIGQDTADQVYRSIVGWFFLYYGAGEALLFGLIALILRGQDEARARRRVAVYSAAAAFCGAIAVGTFLAGLVPWPRLPHPALLLYGLALAWAAAIALAAHAGPWRRHPFGPAGFVCAVTLAVIAADVVAGSRLQIGAPFGLSLLAAGRFYGVGNNALGLYATAGLLTAAWAGAVTLGRRPGSRRLAVAAAGGVALAAVFVAGWPGFGAKVGGTIAMVPAFLLLLAAIAGMRITARRGLIIAVSGLAVVTVFGLIDYLVPAVGASHLGSFVGSVLHGHAGGTLQRKISSNLRSVAKTWYSPVVPVVALVTGLMLAWPARLRLKVFVAACARERLLRPAFFAIWLAVTLSALVDDSGVSTAAAALPLALPLAIAIVVRVAYQGSERYAGIIYPAPGMSGVTGRTG
jgi:hypothetical protein